MRSDQFFAMEENEKKSISVYLIALAVILANLVVLSIVYQVPFLAYAPFFKKSLPLISLAAVYPYDLFRIYFKGDLLVHFYWILLVICSAFGLLLFNKFARIVFIVFNILHFVILGVISVSNFGQPIFWDYFFKCYFNMVAFLLYVGYLTLPEIFKQFQVPNKERRFDLWFLKVRRKALLPKDAEGFYNLALAYQKLGRVDEALEFLTRAIAVVPDKAQYHFIIGQIYFNRQDLGGAIKFLQQTVRLDPIHVQARYLLALAYQKMGCVQEAVEAFRRCSYLEPKNNEVFRSLGMMCYQAGYLEEAQQALGKALVLVEQDHLCHFYMGLILMKSPDHRNDAEGCFKKAVRFKADFIEGYRELGNLYIGQGDYKAAVRAFRDILRLDSQQTQVHYHLGFAYAMLKDMDSARREYKYLKDVDPDLAQTLSLLLSKG